MAWKLILEGVDPVTFNVVASFMAEMLMLSAVSHKQALKLAKRPRNHSHLLGFISLSIHFYPQRRTP